MVNIFGNKVVQKIVIFFLAKGFFVNMAVYFQNMAIRSCDYASQGVIKSQKVVVELGYQFFLKIAYLGDIHLIRLHASSYWEECSFIRQLCIIKIYVA